MKIAKAENYNPFINKKEIDKDGKKAQSFKGASDVLLNATNKLFVALDKNAIVQVAAVDIGTAIGPRTIYDLQTSLAAALETFRREVSGLIVNCIAPGYIVKYCVAEFLNKPKELKDTNVVNSWVNSKSIDELKELYKNAHKSGTSDTTKTYVKSALKSIKGLNGTKWISYSEKANSSEFESAIDDISKAILNQGKEQSKLLKSAKEKLAELTKAESIIKFNGKPFANLEETIRDIADLGVKFNTVENKLRKDLNGKITNEELASAIDKYSNSLKSFVTKKSLIGLGIVMIIAASMQTINRAITRKQFNTEGAPIYKDFGKKDTTQKMDEKQKQEFFLHKIMAAAGMFGLAGLSMMKKPTINMFQFSGIFPTLDQCRWIASATFASRMLASEDENELRETTVRDMVSFSGLYFLGDYAKKAAASFFEMFSRTKIGKKMIGEEVVLLNRKKTVKKPNKKGKINISSLMKYRMQQFTNWIKNTDLKSSNEVISQKVRNIRNICRLFDLAFALALLGIALPVYNRHVTEAKVEEAKQKEEMRKKAMADYSRKLKGNVPSVFENLN